ncbi:hypothetical protein N7536_011081, partial [Penicillium majusculum]
MLELIYRPLFSKAEIVRLGAIVKTFNRTRSISSTPKRNVFSSLFLTRPSSLEISQLPTPRVQSSLDIPKLDLILEGRLACTILSATMHVFQIIMAQFKLRRQGKVYMAGTFGPEDFYGGKEPFIFSTSGLSRSVLSLVGWWDGEILVGLSIRFILCTNGFGDEDNLNLLLSELGTLAQVVAFHRTEPKFQTHPLFPARQNYIDLVSLFSPHCGRIAQARYDRHGEQLEPRISQIFFFATTDDTASNM